MLEITNLKSSNTSFEKLEELSSEEQQNIRGGAFAAAGGAFAAVAGVRRHHPNTGVRSKELGVRS